MPKRYVTIARRPRMDDDWQPYTDATDYLARTVHEPDTSPQPTGLLDAQGNELFAICEFEPIGFVRFD